MRNYLLHSIVVFTFFSGICAAQSFSIKNNPQLHTVSINNSTIKLVVNYDRQCRVSAMNVNGKNVIEGKTGIYSEVQTKGNTFSTLQTVTSPSVNTTPHTAEIKD
ncbi:MAG: hypothetical protein ABI325_08775, partial [Ginsengibacter sp.]